MTTIWGAERGGGTCYTNKCRRPALGSVLWGVLKDGPRMESLLLAPELGAGLAALEGRHTDLQGRGLGVLESTVLTAHKQ